MMTKEAKVGMLTGLAVIVLIGVLLSEYLGGGPNPANGALGSGSRMAVLPVGEGFRQAVMQPVVPAMARHDPAGDVMPIVTGLGEMAPPVAAAGMEEMASGRRPPAHVVAMGPTPGPELATGGLPTLEVRDVPNMPPPPPSGVNSGMVELKKQYVIKAGDNLAKIAKLYYNSSKTSDVQRIVAANPGMLKNPQTALVAGKTLMIPVMVAAHPAGPAVPAGSVGAGTAGSAGVRVPMPGPLSGSPAVKPVKPETAGKLYEVQAGDTVEKIAKRISPANYRDVEQKLMALNGLKDGKDLKAGAKLKLPV